MKATQVLEVLRRDGVVCLGDLLLPDAGIGPMAQAYARRVENVAFNGAMGYHAADPYRRMVHDVLCVEEGFVTMVTNPLLLEVLEAYLGAEAIVTEAKAWRSMPTRRGFHGWHNDAWYDRSLPSVPRQLKLGVYLSDVTSGAFRYLCGTHGQRRPEHWSDEQASKWEGEMKVMEGGAGTAFLFDSSGIHRQSSPLLSERDAAFFVFHDPKTPIQQEDVRAGRYHPVLLRASHLGGLSARQARVLGVGNRELECGAQTPREERRTWLTQVHQHALRWENVMGRVGGRLRRWSGTRG